MLIYRILTALIFIPAVIYAVLCVSGKNFFIISLILLFLMAYEWVRMVNISRVNALILSVLSVTVALIASYYHSECVLLMVLPLWLIAFFRLAKPGQFGVGTTTAGLLMLIGFVLALNYCRALPNGRNFSLYLTFLVWIADTGAYFVGRACGQRRLAPTISPNKSWEGLFGAVILCLFYSFISTYYWLHLSGWPAVMFIAVSFFLTIMSALGDLVESQVKRFYQVKDSGKILPGHGGLLDRFDGFLAVAPFFTVAIIFILHFERIHCTISGCI